MITENNRPTSFLVDKEKEFAREFIKLWRAEETQFYSTMSETMAEFAERTIGSMKNLLYRYMEEYGYKYIHKLSQFITTLNSGKNCLIYLMPKNVKNSILYSEPL